jgi:mannosyl-3-phosphoglycerate phosphatase
VDILAEISGKYHYTIKGFHNSEESEIISRTGLDPEQVKLALTRKFSVPVFYDVRSRNILRAELEKYGLHLLFGGRFMHLLGQVDKGSALIKIMHGYRSKYPSRRFRSLALGDSLNDFAMLRSADDAVLVRKHDGTHETREVIPDVIFSPGIGPAGWNDSILNIIRN